MMQSQKNLISFFTSPENVTFVVDILRHGKQIREALMTEFWLDLAQHLKEHTPTMPSLPTSMAWQLYPSKTDIGGEDGAICYWDNEHDNENDQFLFYTISQDRSKGTFTLDICLEWNQEEDDYSSKCPLYKLDSVAALRSNLAEGFKKGQSYLLYNTIGSFTSVDEFLARIIDAEGKESLLREISDCFWAFVKETVSSVVAANVEVTKSRKKPNPQGRRQM